jgi:hypothetical protein
MNAISVCWLWSIRGRTGSVRSGSAVMPRSRATSVTASLSRLPSQFLVLLPIVNGYSASNPLTDSSGVPPAEKLVESSVTRPDSSSAGPAP